ncbi:hypothetical protein Tco_0005198 [Tanacetum coccineum]
MHESDCSFETWGLGVRGYGEHWRLERSRHGCVGQSGEEDWLDKMVVGERAGGALDGWYGSLALRSGERCDWVEALATWSLKSNGDIVARRGAYWVGGVGGVKRGRTEGCGGAESAFMTWGQDYSGILVYLRILWSGNRPWGGGSACCRALTVDWLIPCPQRGQLWKLGNGGGAYPGSQVGRALACRCSSSLANSVPAAAVNYRRDRQALSGMIGVMASVWLLTSARNIQGGCLGIADTGGAWLSVARDERIFLEERFEDDVSSSLPSYACDPRRLQSAVGDKVEQMWILLRNFSRGCEGSRATTSPRGAPAVIHDGAPTYAGGPHHRRLTRSSVVLSRAAGSNDARSYRDRGGNSTAVVC